MSNKVTYTYQDTEEQDLNPAPAGTYIFRVIKAEYTISQSTKHKGSDEIKLFLGCAENDGDEEIGFAVDSLLFVEKMAWKNDLFLKSSGYAMQNGLKKGDPVTFDPLELFGLRGWCQVEVQTYEKNGEERSISKVKKYLASKGMVDPIRPNEEDVPFA